MFPLRENAIYQDRYPPLRRLTNRTRVAQLVAQESKKQKHEIAENDGE